MKSILLSTLFILFCSNKSAADQVFVPVPDEQKSNYQQQKLQKKLSNIKMAASSGVVTITQPSEGAVFHPGATDHTGFIGSAKTTIAVAVLSKLTGITVYPEDNPVDLIVGDTLSLIVYGKYSDNVKRKIQSPSSGTLYTSSNSSVAEVSSKGDITGKSQGKAVVTVKNAEIKKEINIRVLNATENN